MATEAQVLANRSNAQKSTGPRTPEGKAVVARNAVKHGLTGEQTVVEGENRREFALHREEMLRALVPVGEIESKLAERLVGVFWRLQRVERLQVQTFEALCAAPVEGPEGEGANEELTLGRIVVKDFSEARVLDKLLMYERRIEHSLCRMLGELRQERLSQSLEARTRDQGNPPVLRERLMGKKGSEGWEGGSGAKGQGAGLTCEVSRGTPAVGASNSGFPTPAMPGMATPEPLVEIRPIGQEIRLAGLGLGGRTPACGALDLDLLCKTKPISVGGNTKQVLVDAGVREDLVPEGLEKTKPISAEGGRGIPPQWAVSGADYRA